MQISNTYWKRFISAIVLCVFLLGAGYSLGDLLRPFSFATDIYAKEYGELKSQGKRVELILVGASRMRAFDPEILKDKLFLNEAFNLAVAQLKMEGAYYQLKEFVKEFHPKYVVIGITEGVLTSDETPIITKLQLSERLHGINRLEYIKNCFSFKEYPYLVSVFGYRDNLSSILNNIQEKQQFKEEGIYMRTKWWKSMGNGFQVCYRTVRQGNMGIESTRKFNKLQISDKTKLYLDKCVQLCKDNNIQLVFVSPPTSMAHIYSISNFQDIVDYVTDYANKNNVPYHNLSYLKDREIFFPDTMFYDFKHINKNGAAVVSEKYAEILSRCLHGADINEYFYGSLNELKESVDRVVAVDSKPIIKNGVIELSVRSLQNKDVIPNYQVLRAQTGEDFKSIVNWTSNKTLSFRVPKGKKCSVLLRARHKENTSSYAWRAWEVDSKGEVRKTEKIPKYMYLKRKNEGKN